MNYRLGWNQAIAISMAFHFIFFMGIGLLLPLFPAPDITEQLVELDLASYDLPLNSDPGPAGPPEPTAAAPSAMEQIQEAVKQFVPPDEAAPIEAEKVAQSVASQQAIARRQPGNAAVQQRVSGGNPASGSSAGGQQQGTAAGSGTGGGNGTGIQAPRVLDKVEPPYPQAARQAGQEGTVLLKVEVLANGRTGDVSVLTSSQFNELDRVAVETVRKWRFIPAQDQSSGKKVACYTRIPMTFRLQ